MYTVDINPHRMLPSCPKCGGDLEEAICPTCGIVDLTIAPIEGEPRHLISCRHCSQDLPAYARFCHRCGKPSKQEPRLNVAQVKKPSKAWYLLPILLSWVGSVVGYFALKDRHRTMARDVAIAGSVMFFIVMFTFIALPLHRIDIPRQERTTRTMQGNVVTLESIENLAYIRISAIGYSDDNDPEYEGFDIYIAYYDARSETIHFENTAVVAHIELFGYGSFVDEFEHKNMRLVYKHSIILDHSPRLEEIVERNYLRIPFEEVAVDGNECYVWGTLKVTVETAGGSYSASDWAPLYASEGAAMYATNHFDCRLYIMIAGRVPA